MQTFQCFQDWSDWSSWSLAECLNKNELNVGMQKIIRNCLNPEGSVIDNTFCLRVGDTDALFEKESECTQGNMDQ